MSRSPRPRPRPGAVALSTAALVALTGCSGLQTLVGGVEPERDASTGDVVEAVRADAFALRVGDCLDLSDEPVVAEDAPQEFTSVPTVPCAEEHDSEIFASHQLHDDVYPGDEAVAAAAEDLCYADFAGFVGTPYEESALDFTVFYPTSDGWDVESDREVLCVVLDPAAVVTGTLASARR